MFCRGSFWGASYASAAAARDATRRPAAAARCRGGAGTRGPFAWIEARVRMVIEESPPSLKVVR